MSYLRCCPNATGALAGVSAGAGAVLGAGSAPGAAAGGGALMPVRARSSAIHDAHRLVLARQLLVALEFRQCRHRIVQVQIQQHAEIAVRGGIAGIAADGLGVGGA